MKRIFIGLMASFWSITALSNPIKIQVTDFWGRLAPQTAVMVGPRVDVPFANNIMITNSTGMVEFAEAALVDTPITLVAPGHPRITYFGQSGASFVLRLPPPTPQKFHQVSGQFSRWGRVPSGHAQFGLMFPLLRPDKVFNFNIADVVSTTTDTLTAAGQSVNIPSNLVIPKQTIQYGFFSVTVDKPIFRMPVESPATYSLAGLSGHFPVKQVIDKFRGGKNFFDIINDLELKQFGLIRDVTVTQPVSNLNIAQDQGQLEACLKVTSQNIPQGLEVVGLGLVEDVSPKVRGYQITDLKKLSATAANMKCIKNDSRPVTVMTVGVSYHKEGKAIAFDNAMSSILIRNVSPRNTSQVSATNYFEVPQVTINRAGQSVSVTRPESNRGSPRGQALFGTLNEVTRTDMGQFIAEEVIPQWVVFAPESTTALDLPELPSQLRYFGRLGSGVRARTQKVRRWDMIWLGMDPALHHDARSIVSVDLGYDLFETMTHASRNSKDF